MRSTKPNARSVPEKVADNSKFNFIDLSKSLNQIEVGLKPPVRVIMLIYTKIIQVKLHHAKGASDVISTGSQIMLDHKLNHIIYFVISELCTNVQVMKLRPL